jgi:hypothetical protein
MIQVRFGSIHTLSLDEWQRLPRYELAAPVASHHDRKIGIIAACISLPMIRYRWSKMALAMEALVIRRLVKIPVGVRRLKEQAVPAHGLRLIGIPPIS